ncbi:MAG TPA: thioesterase family protein [Methylomirabilota bacterium]|jgi:acyl-CoA thioesterase FadM|nr:thioesterase family protein [Methylomirabilota bacterium]
MSWLETYRGTVYRWEVDNVDHFTVAYYFARFEDATMALLHAVGLDPGPLADKGQACATVECRVSYRRELRMGDILHIRSGVISVDDGGLVFGHHVLDSGDGALCTTVLQRAALVELGSRAPVALTRAQREAAHALRIEWPDAVEAPAPAAPADDARFIDTARDTVKPWELDVLGQAGFPAYIHRFSAANAHVLAGFGMTPAYMKEHHCGFSTFEFRLRFPGALRAGDPVLVRSGLLHIGNSSMRLLHRMRNVRTDETVATLEQAGVHLDLDARRPTPLPPPLRERANAMLVVAS